MGHRALRHLAQHRERGLLDRKREVLERVSLLQPMQRRGQEAAERDIHPLHGIWKREEVRTLLRGPFEDGPPGEPVTRLSCKLVEQVPDPDVEGLAEHSIAASGEGDYLRVSPAHIQEHRVLAPALGPANLQMRDAMVHSYDRDTEREGEGPRRSRDGPEAGA